MIQNYIILIAIIFINHNLQILENIRKVTATLTHCTITSRITLPNNCQACSNIIQDNIH